MRQTGRLGNAMETIALRAPLHHVPSVLIVYFLPNMVRMSSARDSAQCCLTRYSGNWLRPMDLYEKIRSLPTQPGCYLYKNAEGEVIYVGKAKNLRQRVRSYLLEASQADAKTGSLMREAADLDYILVANEHEALALENNLIKQRKPRFNILLRDDKTYPYVK